MKDIHKETTKRDAKILELRNTLKSVLQRYQDLSYMETPEWDFSEEIPVRHARKVLKDEYSEEICNEFFQLRKLVRALRIYKKYRSALASVENGTVFEKLEINLADLDELESKVDDWWEKVKQRLDTYLNLKTNEYL